MNDLEKLGETKKEFDQSLKAIGHNISPEILANTPVAKWITAHDQAQGGWLKRFFTKIKINAAAKKLGYEKFSDMEILSDIGRAADLQKSITTLAPPFEEDKIWQGWDTTYDSLNEASIRGRAAYKALVDTLGLTDDF